MKLYVITAKKLIVNLAIVIALFTAVGLNYNQTKAVFQNEASRKLPIYNVQREDKVCAISFDAAWGNEDTHDLIEILKNYKVKATFFVVGDWVDRFPESVKELDDAGHDIMNHSNSHPHMTQISKEKMIEEITECDNKIEKLTGKKPNLFRPPYGDYNDNVITTMHETGHYTIQWNIDSLDWKDLSADEIFNRVTKNVENGSIILFHNAAKNTPEALPRILEKLQNDGFKIIKINDLIYKDNYYMDTAGKQIPINKEVTPLPDSTEALPEKKEKS